MKCGVVLVSIFLVLLSSIACQHTSYSQPASDPSNLTIFDQSVVIKSDGKHIVGQIKNISNRTLSNVKVLTSFYDQNNKFLGSDITYLEPPIVNPNELSKFDLKISSTSSDISFAKEYTLTIAWQNQDGTPGYFVTNQQTKKLEREIENSLTKPPADYPDRINGSELTSYGRTLNVKYIGTIGATGSDSAKFLSPAGIEYESSHDRIYVSELGNNRIQIFDSSGRFISSWGTAGNGPGQFDLPGDVAIDSTGKYAYVSDIDNNRIQKFYSNGTFLSEWGSFGTGDGQFNQPGDIAIDTTEKFLYITDVQNNRVQKFDTDGEFMMKWGTGGNGPGQFDNPTGIATGDHGEVYVADTENDRVLRFDSEGNFVEKWDSLGNAGGKFGRPDGIIFDNAMNLVYVSDRSNGKIIVFTDQGKLFYQLDLEKSTNGLKVKPRDITLDQSGKLFVVDKDNNRILVFTTR